MKFLVDAQLPARLARFLADAGHDAVHTSELPDGNRTTDVRVAEVADGEDRVVVTKDRDFRDGHLLSASPRPGRKSRRCGYERRCGIVGIAVGVAARQGSTPAARRLDDAVGVEVAGPE